MAAFRSTNLALRFLLELCALAALSYWGFRTGRDLPTAVALGVGAPLVVAVVWALFIAPRARVQLSPPLPFISGLAILVLAAICLALAGQPLLAWILGAAAVLNAVLLYVQGEFRTRQAA